MKRILFLYITIGLVLISCLNKTTIQKSTYKNIVYKDTIISGFVVDITDGDTFKLLTKDSTLLKIRLANIDCPEKKQPYSKQAKQFVSDVILNKIVLIEISKNDRYGRSIANVIYNDSLNLNHELVKHGLAWHYVKYSNDTLLQGIEGSARLKRIGLWSDANPIAPWEWRSTKRK